MAFNGAFFNRGGHRGGHRGGYRGNNYNPNYHQQNAQNSQNNQVVHGGTPRGGHQNSSYKQTFAAPVDKNDYSRKRSFSQAEISFIKKSRTPPTNQKPTKLTRKNRKPSRLAVKNPHSLSPLSETSTNPFNSTTPKTNNIFVQNLNM